MRKTVWTRFRAVPRIAAALTVALVVTACGASSSSEPTADTSGPPAGLDRLLAYTGGSGAVAADAPTFDIGWINVQGGTPSTPETTESAQAAVDVVNDYLGGINGHRLVLNTCFVSASDEEGQQCGQKFVNDPQIKAVLTGGIQIGVDSFHRVIDGKLPVYVGAPLYPSSVTTKNSFAANAGAFGSSPGFVAYSTQYLKAKTVAVVSANDDPASTNAAKNISAAFDQAGVTVTQASFATAATDLVSPLVAAGVDKADVVVAVVVSPPTVIAVAKGLQQLGVTAPVLGIGSALNPSLKEGLGGDYPKWTFNFVSLNPGVEDPAGDVKAFRGTLEKYSPNTVVAASSAFGFGAVTTFVKIVNDMSEQDPTPEQIAAAIGAFKGPGFLNPPTFDYGSIPDLPGLGTNQSRFYSYDGSDSWTDKTDGKWISPEQ